MNHFKIIFLYLIIFGLFISCGKNEPTDKIPAAKTKEESKQNSNINTVETAKYLEKEQNNSSSTDSINATKESILRKQRYKKIVVQTSKDTLNSGLKNQNNFKKPTSKNSNFPSFVYIKKILNECKIGVPMTQKQLQSKFNIPKEAIQLIKSVTKISHNEMDVKWKSTWLIEQISDAEFKDGRLKVRFNKDRMYTSGGALAIKYGKKRYTDLYLIGRSAYIPTVKGFYWEIGNL